MKPTFRHLLEHTEDGTGPDERLGLKEVHGGGQMLSPKLLLLVLHQDRVQPLLRIGQHDLPARLHGGLQLDQGLPLTRVGVAQTTGTRVQEQTGHRHKGALPRHRHAPNPYSWRRQQGPGDQKNRPCCSGNRKQPNLYKLLKAVTPETRRTSSSAIIPTVSEASRQINCLMYFFTQQTALNTLSNRF